MPSVARKGDSCTGHGCWPPRPIVEGSSDVFINNIGCASEGSKLSSHTCPSIPETHDGVITSGGKQVFVNGKEIATVGMPVSCGSFVAGGSSNVFTGG